MRPGKLSRRPWRVALVAALGAYAGAADAADRLSTRLEVFAVLGLHVLTLHSYLDETSDRYTVTTDYATTGVAGLLVQQSSRAQTVGRFTALSVEPTSYRAETRRNGVEIRSSVDYGPDGSVVGSSTPAPANPVAAAAARGTVDNLTAYFRLQRQLAAGKGCNLTVPVFDGRYRYELVFEDAGRKVLSPEGGQQFEGPAIACRMTRRLPDEAKGEEIEGAREGTIWYAALLPGDVPVPVRMTLDTQIGSVDGFLAELHGRGVDRVLMK